MKKLIGLAFFLWLAIAACMVWVTDDMGIAGRISIVWLCLLSFFGGIAGLSIILTSVINEED